MCGNTWRYRYRHGNKKVIFCNVFFIWWRCVATGIATENKKWRCFKLFSFGGDVWQYGIATENKKNKLFSFGGDVWQYVAIPDRHRNWKNLFFSTFFLGGDVWRYRTVSPQKLKNLVFFNFFFWWRCVAIPYCIATEIEKSCFFQLFFFGGNWKILFFSTFFFGGDVWRYHTVSPQKLKNLVFFNFFFWWRCVAIRRYRTVSPQKLKNLVFFNFFFGGDVWRYRTVSPQKLKKSCFFQLFFLVAMCGDTVRYRHRNWKILFFSIFFFGGDVWRYRTVSPQKLKNLVFFNFFFLVAMCGDTEIEKSCFFQLFFLVAYGIATEIEKSCFFLFFFWWRCVAIPYGVATEIEKSCFFQFFFLVAMCGDTVRYRHRNWKIGFFSTFFFGGDVWRYRTVSPQKLKNLVFFNFFFWWRCVAIRRYRTVSPQKLKNLVFFNFFFWWRSVAIPYGIATEIEKSCFFHFFFGGNWKSCFFQVFFWVAMFFSWKHVLGSQVSDAGGSGLE